MGEMSNESIAADPPMYAAFSIIDEVDCLYILCNTANGGWSQRFTCLHLSTLEDPSLIQFFLGSYPVHIKNYAL